MTARQRETRSAPVRLAAGAALCALLVTAGGCREDESFHVGGMPHMPPHDGTAVALLPADQDNHLLPLYVGIDPGGNSLYTSCNALPTIAEIDLVAGELVWVHDLGFDHPGHAKVFPDGADRVWFSWEGEPGDPTVIRLDPATREVDHLDTGLLSIYHGVGLRDGGVAFAGQRGGLAPSQTALQILDRRGEIVTEAILGAEVIAMIQDSDGALALLIRSAEGQRAGVFRLRPTDLAIIDECLEPEAEPFAGGFGMLAELPDGGYAAAQDDAVHRIHCDGQPWRRQQLTDGHRDIVVVDEQILVFNGTGTDETAGPNWGIARRWDHDLEPLDPWYATGKNSRYGRADRESGLVWFNSEGTTEVWGMDPADGSIVHRIQLGEHIESLAVSPQGRVLYTGRLSNAFGLVDFEDETVHDVREAVTWPVAPVWQGTTVWLLDQLASTLYEIDGETLAILDVHDLGLDDNTLLTFSDVAYHAGRQTVFVAHSEQGVLVEYDPRLHVPVQRWQLHGPALSDDDLTGRLELFVLDHGVITFRNADGVFNLVDPDQDEVAGWTQLHPEDVDALRADKRIDQGLRTANGQRIYAGGFAVDTATLQRRPEYDLPVTALIADLHDGVFLGWRQDDLAVVVVDSDGQTLAEQVLPLNPQGEPALAYVPGDDPALIFTEFRRAEFRRLPLRKLFLDAGLL